MNAPGLRLNRIRPSTASFIFQTISQWADSVVWRKTDAGFNNIHAIRTHYLPVISVSHALNEIANALVEEMDKTGELTHPIYPKVIIRK